MAKNAHLAQVLSCAIVFSTMSVSQAELPDLSHWKTVLSFRPTTEVQKSVRSHGTDWAVHRIEDAVGDVYLDIYSVHVSKLPTKDGTQLQPHEILEHVRRNLNDFSDLSIAHFKPFDDKEALLWESDDPTGAIVLIDMPVLGLNPDSGCVVMTRRTVNEWIFSTVRSGAPPGLGNPAVAHPVSGNRAFGVYETDSGKYVFYTVAADRLTRRVDRLAELFGSVTTAQAKLWKTFQTKLAKFINDNGGQASIGLGDAKHVDWDAVKTSKYFDVSSQPKWE